MTMGRLGRIPGRIVLVAALLLTPGMLQGQSRSSIAIALGPERLSRDLSRLGFPNAVEWGIAGNLSWVHGMSDRYGIGIALDLDAWSGAGHRFISFSPAARFDVVRSGRVFISLGPGLATDLVREECLSLADVQVAQLRTASSSVGCPSWSNTEYLLVAAGAGAVLPVSRRISVTLRGRFLRTFLAPAERHPTRYPLQGVSIMAGIEVR